MVKKLTSAAFAGTSLAVGLSPLSAPHSLMILTLNAARISKFGKIESANIPAKCLPVVE